MILVVAEGSAAVEVLYHPKILSQQSTTEGELTGGGGVWGVFIKGVAHSAAQPLHNPVQFCPATCMVWRYSFYFLNNSSKFIK